MCGIFAINKVDLTQEQKKVINESLAFRGPDFQSGCIEYSGWTLYHSRLSIIGLDQSANQPLIGTGGALLFNGEIFNYKELGEKYFEQKYHSDTRLLYDLIENDCLSLDELDGFFAFIFIDQNGAIKYCARDQFGVKPLFKFSNPDKSTLAVSSEAVAFKRLFNLTFSQEALEEYRVLRYPMFKGSYFEGVDAIEPGTCFVTGSYFNLDKSKQDILPKANFEETKNALLKGIQTRKVSDAKIGLLISKGVDSNLIRCLSGIKELYCVGFEGDEDLEFAKNNLSEITNIVECTKKEYRDCFEKLIALRGEPLSVPNEVLLYLIGKKAQRNGVKVLLSGEGADEFFGGYDRIYKWAAQSKNNFDLESFLDLYTYQAPVRGSTLWEKFSHIFDQLTELSCFEKVRYFFIKYHMPVLFRRLDFSLMAAGIEGREPIANKWVYEVAMRYHPDELMVDSFGKKPLRELLLEYEDASLAYAKKVGFPVNISDIFEDHSGKSNYEIWFEKNMETLEI